MARKLEAGWPRRPVGSRPMQIMSRTEAPSAMRMVTDVLDRRVGGRRLTALRLAQRRKRKGSPTVLRDQPPRVGPYWLQEMVDGSRRAASRLGEGGVYVKVSCVNGMALWHYGRG
jgi:hypothetical protein